MANVGSNVGGIGAAQQVASFSGVGAKPAIEAAKAATAMADGVEVGDTPTTRVSKAILEAKDL
jgi:DNA-binding beta-propeller fold protein YncE